MTGSPHTELFWRFGPQRTVRRGNWKLVRWRDFAEKTDSAWQLYDISKDVGEANDLAARHPERVADLSQAWERWNQRNVTPLWHGTPNEDPTSPLPPAAAGKTR